MFQIGVVGSVSSVKRIIDMAVNFGEDINFTAYPYTDFQETRKIITAHDHKIDVWFFSGELPYLIAREVLKSEEHLVYVENTEASLYKCFLQMTENQAKSLERFSLDDTTEELIDGAMRQLGFQSKEVYLKTFGVQTNPKDLYDFHLGLWNDGKTDAVITSFEKVYKELNTAGVPAYWYSISDMEINHSFRVLKEKVRTFHFKEMQTGIVIIDITGFYKIIQKAKSPYQIQYLELGTELPTSNQFHCQPRFVGPKITRKTTFSPNPTKKRPTLLRISPLPSCFIHRPHLFFLSVRLGQIVCGKSVQRQCAPCRVCSIKDDYRVTIFPLLLYVGFHRKSYLPAGQRVP